MKNPWPLIHTRWHMFLIALKPKALEFVPDYFQTQKMCEKAAKDELEAIKFVSDYLKMQKMCEKAVEKNNWCLEFVHDHFRTEKMCEKA